MKSPTRRMLDEVMSRYQEGLAILNVCKDQALDALEAEPDPQLATLHDHFREAQLSFLKAHEVLIRLERREQEKELH